MPSLILLERDERVRSRLVEWLLSTAPGISIIGQAGDAEQLLEVCRTGPWDVGVISLVALSNNALKLLMFLRQTCPQLPLVAICFSLDVPRLALVQRNEVNGLVASEDLPDELVAAVRAALALEPYLSRGVRQALGGPAPTSSAPAQGTWIE